VTLGPLLASGRDADIFEAGPGLVLRRSTSGRSLAAEAEVMEHVRKAGFPAPRIEELRADGTELVMERLDGPLMGEMVARRPWLFFRLAGLLAELHGELGAITAPKELRQHPAGGDATVHLDLHPLNVIMTKGGPVVIDWANASRGRPEIDVAYTWVVMRSSEVPGSLAARTIVNGGRNVFLRSFLRGVDKVRAREALPSVIDARMKDPHVTEAERRFLARWASSLPSVP
jgi:aminoglycoside phosphotransferase (APT) family kinase protein